jgi:hypothetical protein
MLVLSGTSTKPPTALEGVVLRFVAGGNVPELSQPAAAPIVDDPAELASEPDDPGCLVVLQHASNRH